MTIICNTSPIINFAETGLIEILQKLHGTVVIPHAVEKELREKSELFPIAATVPDMGFIKTIDPTSRSMCRELERDVHAGEAACLALGLESKSPRLILDDVAARQVARHHRLKFIGTLGCLLEAKQRKIIPTISPAIREMKLKARFWLSSDLHRTVLRAAGEDDLE